MTVTNDTTMTASEMILNFDPGECHEYEELFRLSPEGRVDVTQEAYRCPVSTPADNRRVDIRSRPSSYVTFTNLNRSLSLPRQGSYQKYSNQRLLQSRRQLTKPQKKDMGDCYFVRKGGNSVHTDAPVRTGWLSSLCSQPVGEIFGKYKRKSEAGQLSNASLRTRNFSTPGEKALFNAWTSNASHRSTPPVSRNIPAGPVVTPRSSRSNECDPYLRFYGHDHEPDRLMNTPGFALMPVHSTNDIELIDDLSESTGSSPMTRKTAKSSQSNYTNNNSIVNNSIAGLSETTQNIGSSIYDAYQRERKFPEFKKARRPTYSPTKKRVVPLDGKDHVPMPAKQELEESSIQIFSIGHFGDVEPFTDQSNSKTSPERPTSLPPCSFRLPKSFTMDLPEVKGKG